MDDHIHAAQRAVDRKRIRYVGHDKLGIPVQIGWPLTTGAVDLRREVIEQPDIVSRAEYRVGGMRADESGASRNQNTCHSLALLVQ